jgi:hypothetical protein
VLPLEHPARATSVTTARAGMGRRRIGYLRKL